MNAKQQAHEEEEQDSRLTDWEVLVEGLGIGGVRPGRMGDTFLAADG